MVNQLWEIKHEMCCVCSKSAYKNNMIKLPISFKGKSATNEYGIDNLYNNDNVYVEGYNDTFKVTMYDNQVMRYIPFF